jgi:hypothetical protein
MGTLSGLVVGTHFFVFMFSPCVRLWGGVRVPMQINFVSCKLM